MMSNSIEKKSIVQTIDSLLPLSQTEKRGRFNHLTGEEKKSVVKVINNLFLNTPPAITDDDKMHWTTAHSKLLENSSPAAQTAYKISSIAAQVFSFLSVIKESFIQAMAWIGDRLGYTTSTTFSRALQPRQQIRNWIKQTFYTEGIVEMTRDQKTVTNNIINDWTDPSNDLINKHQDEGDLEVIKAHFNECKRQFEKDVSRTKFFSLLDNKDGTRKEVTVFQAPYMQRGNFLKHYKVSEREDTEQIGRKIETDTVMNDEALKALIENYSLDDADDAAKELIYFAGSQSLQSYVKFLFPQEKVVELASQNLKVAQGQGAIYLDLQRNKDGELVEADCVSQMIFNFQEFIDNTASDYPLCRAIVEVHTKFVPHTPTREKPYYFEPTSVEWEISWEDTPEMLQQNNESVDFAQTQHPSSA